MYVFIDHDCNSKLHPNQANSFLPILGYARLSQHIDSLQMRSANVGDKVAYRTSCPVEDAIKFKVLTTMDEVPQKVTCK